MCRGEEVVVVGGGNSAGQAAVFLAQASKRVHMLVRSSGLAETMSRYLIRRIEQNPAIVLSANTEIVALEGQSSSRTSELARPSVRQHRNPRHTTRLSHDRCRSQHTVARRVCRARCRRVHQDGTQSVTGGSGDRALAAYQGSPSSRNLFARRVRGRRRPEQ